MKCDETCTARKERNGEIFCFAHGTIDTNYQLMDSVAEVYEDFPYSDNFIYNAVTKGTCLDIHDLADYLKVNEMQVHRAFKRAQKANIS